MVKVTDKDFYMDGYLEENLQTAKDVISKDWDMIFAVDGGEGSGKSVFAMQCAYFCDPSFNIDRVVFTPKQFKKAVLESKKFQAFVYDEAYTGLSARATMTLINRTLVSMLAEIRQKNLFLFIVMPCFFDLDKYVALWRSRALFHVYTGDGFQRGFFSFYNVEKKKELYVYGKKFYDYKKPKPNFRGRFTKAYVIDEMEYKQRKAEALTERSNKAEEIAMTKEIQKKIFERLYCDKLLRDKIPNVMKARIIGISESHYYNFVNDYENLKEFS